MFLIDLIALGLAIYALSRVSKLQSSNRVIREALIKMQTELVQLRSRLESGIQLAPSPTENTSPANSAFGKRASKKSDPERPETAPAIPAVNIGPVLSAEIKQPQTPTVPLSVSPSKTEPPKPQKSEPPTPRPTVVPKETPGKNLFKNIEQALAGRWFVVLGGIAIALAGLLFIKYANDNGLIPPFLRVLVGYAFAGALIYGGEFVRKQRPAGIADYVPAALSAAGLVIAFGVTYAAYALYNIFSPTICFPLLAAIGLAAIYLSRVQGPLIAALGLIGSYSAPALVPSDHPSAFGFFAYLLVIVCAALYELRSRPWWWLGFSAIGGAFAWSVLWLHGMFDDSQIIVVAIFAFVLALAATFVPRGRAALTENYGTILDAKIMQPPLQIALAGGTAGSCLLALLVRSTQHSFLSLVFFAAGMAAVSAYGWLRQHRNAAALLATALTLAVLLSWSGVSDLQPAFDDRGFWTLVPGQIVPTHFVRWMLAALVGFGGLGLYGVLRKPFVSPWDLVAAISTLFLFGAWARADFVLSNGTWAALAALVAGLFLATVYLLRSKLPETETNSAVTTFVTVAALAALFAADRLFDDIWYTIAIAVLAAAFALGAKFVNTRVFGVVASALAGFASIRLFIGREFWSTPEGLPFGQHWPIYGYGIPAVLFWLGARGLRDGKDEKARVSLEGLSLGLLISLVSLELRVLIGGGATSREFSLLELSSHVTAWLGAAYGLAYRQKIYSSLVSRWGTFALVLASAGVLAVLLTLKNPLVSGEVLAGNALVNTLWLAYALPAVLLMAITRQLSGLGLQQVVRPAQALITVLAVAFVSLMVRRWFQGPAMQIEFASYLEFAVLGIVWLGAALACVEWSQRQPGELQRWLAYAFGGLAALLLIAGLTVHNPVFTRDAIGPNALINPLWLGYFIPAVVLASIGNRGSLFSTRPYREILGSLALALTIMFVTLMVKRAYQGEIIDPHFMSQAENYTVSLAWLILSFATFAGGLKLDRQYIRIAGLGVMALTVLKVFIYDFAELGGLLRIASLLGLGLSLVGIGWLYTRFVHKPSEADASS